jgi:hypothetical protein
MALLISRSTDLGTSLRMSVFVFMVNYSVSHFWESAYLLTRSGSGAADGSAQPLLLGWRRTSRQAKPGNCCSGLRALERDEDIPGPALCLERGGPALVQVRRVVAYCQRVAVQGIDPLPRLTF